jgi:hypothetical protein
LGTQIFAEKRAAAAITVGQPRIAEQLNAESKEIVLMPE